MTYESRKMSVREMIERLSEDDLYKLRFDLDSGGKHLRHLVEERIRTVESKPKKVCATCGTFLSDESSIYTLTFGPSDFRKRAYFCGQDCLEYFLERLKAAKAQGTLHPSDSSQNPPSSENPETRAGPDISAAFPSEAKKRSPSHYNKRQGHSIFRRILRWSKK